MADSARPRFSVIIPTYNYGRYLPTALDSVLDQSRDDVEIVVVDDASTDSTPEIVSRYTRHVEYLRLRSNVGPARAWGVGLERVTGQYVCKLDADDWQLPRFLEVMGAAMDDSPSAGLAATSVFAHDELGHTRPALVGAPAGLLDAPKFRLRLLGQFFFFMPGIMLRREAILGHAPPRTDLWMAHDWEYLIRTMRGWSCLVLDEPLAVYRMHPGSVTQTGHRTERLLSDMTILHEIASSSDAELSLTDQERERFGLALAETYLRLTPLNLLRFDVRQASRHVNLAMQLAGGSQSGSTSSKLSMLGRVFARKGKSHLIWRFGSNSVSVETLLPRPSGASSQGAGDKPVS